MNTFLLIFALIIDVVLMILVLQHNSISYLRIRSKLHIIPLPQSDTGQVDVGVRMKCNMQHVIWQATLKYRCIPLYEMYYFESFCPGFLTTKTYDTICGNG